MLNIYFHRKFISVSILVLEALSREFRTGVPWELLYADDLVVIADSLEECISKLRVWKDGSESQYEKYEFPDLRCGSQPPTRLGRVSVRHLPQWCGRELY